MLREVNEVPKNDMRRNRSILTQDIEDFLASGMRVAEVTVEGKTAHQVVAIFAAYVRRHPEVKGRVRCAKRGDRVYLFRPEPDASLT